MLLMQDNFALRNLEIVDEKFLWAPEQFWLTNHKATSHNKRNPHAF